MAILATDNFNRANENPLANGVWTTPAWAANGCQLYNNQCSSNGPNSSSAYTGITWPNDQYGKITIANVVAAKRYSVTLRDTGSDCYRVIADLGANTLQIYRQLGGNIGSSTSWTMSNNDILEFRVQGTTLTGFVNGAQQITQTDGTLTAGNVGLWIEDSSSTMNLDNFEGGDFSGGAYTLTANQTSFTLSGVTLALRAAQMGRPASDIATNGWTPSTGGTLYGCIDEATADDADYILSPNNPTTEVAEVKFGALADPISSVDHIVRYRLQSTGLDSTFTVSLVCNTTVIKQWFESVTVAGGIQQFEHTLSGGEADAITDYSDLRLRVMVSA